MGRKVCIFLTWYNPILEIIVASFYVRYSMGTSIGKLLFLSAVSINLCTLSPLPTNRTAWHSHISMRVELFGCSQGTREMCSHNSYCIDVFVFVYFYIAWSGFLKISENISGLRTIYQVGFLSIGNSVLALANVYSLK